jgi:hypothetical protein
MDQPPLQPGDSPNIVYPPPPEMHWAVLLAAFFVYTILVMICAPKEYWKLLSNLAEDAWALYLCLWLLKLDKNSMCIYWCAAFVAVRLALSFPSAMQPLSSEFKVFAAVLAFLYIVLWLVTIYSIRNELQTHYNRIEPIGLQLGGIMTFFFSFLYFQYHLYKIAQLKQRYGSRPFYYQGVPPLP